MTQATGAETAWSEDEWDAQTRMLCLEAWYQMPQETREEIGRHLAAAAALVPSSPRPDGGTMEGWGAEAKFWLSLMSVLCDISLPACRCDLAEGQLTQYGPR